MDPIQGQVAYDAVLVYQVPFCNPFWTPANALSKSDDQNQPTLWEILPDDCKTSSNVVLALASLVVIFSAFIHLSTIVAFSNMKDEVLQKMKEFKREGRISRRRDAMKKGEPSFIKESADFAFAMQTQNRLRRSLAFIGLISSTIQLPLLLASTSEAYSSPFFSQHIDDFSSKVENYRLAISAIFHLTLTASLATFLLMIVERIRETLRMCPNDYFKLSQSEEDKTKLYSDNADFERASNFPGTGSVKSDHRPWKTPRDVKTENTMVPEAALMYSFRESYSFIDLITVLLVPATSAIVTTIALAVFNSRFETYGSSIRSSDWEVLGYIPGILSYDIAYYPNIVYFYAGTVGVLIVLVIVASIISTLRCQDMLSTAKHLDGYEQSVHLYKQSEIYRKKGSEKKYPSLFKTGPDSVRLSRRRKWNHKTNRQDPDGLSISRDEIDEEFESSISNIPLPPPPPIVRNSVISFDDLSLPPPPRPESILEIPKQLQSSPSLSSMVKDDSPTEVRDFVGERIATEKTRAFFGNIRQSRISLIAFFLTLLIFAPALILFMAGIFYPHDDEVAGIMGGSFVSINATSQDELGIVESRGKESTTESSTYKDEPSPLLTDKFNSSFDRTDEKLLLRSESIGIRRNWIATLSAVFLILYSLGSTAPFFTFYISLPQFRKEVKRFFSFLLCCKWRLYRENKSQQGESVPDRSRTNRSVAMRSQSLRSRTIYQGSPRSMSLARDISLAVPQRIATPLRREQTIAAPRYVSWEFKEAMSVNEKNST